MNEHHKKRVELATEWGADWRWFTEFGKLRVSVCAEMGWPAGIDLPKTHPYYQISKFIDDEIKPAQAKRLVNSRRALRIKIAEWIMRIS